MELLLIASHGWMRPFVVWIPSFLWPRLWTSLRWRRRKGGGPNNGRSRQNIDIVSSFFTKLIQWTVPCLDKGDELSNTRSENRWDGKMSEMKMRARTNNETSKYWAASTLHMNKAMLTGSLTDGWPNQWSEFCLMLLGSRKKIMFLVNVSCCHCYSIETIVLIVYKKSAAVDLWWQQMSILISYRLVDSQSQLPFHWNHWNGDETCLFFGKFQ